MCYGVAAFDAGVPGLKHSLRMFVGPVEGDGASALQHHDERLAGCGYGLKQFLLGRGQVDAGPVAAAEAIDLDVHLLALELRRESYERDNDVGLLGLGDGFVQESLCGRNPF